MAKSAPAAAAARQNSNGNGDDQRQRLFVEFRAKLNNESFRKSIASLVPSDFRTVGYVDRLIESIFVAVRDNPDLLLKCDRASLFRAAERLAKKGLTVGDNVAWLVPYKGQVQDQLGYKGAMMQVRRSGVPVQISCQAVFENDRCKIRLGTDAVVEHEPFLDGDRGEMRGCYSFAKYLESGEVDVEWMSADEIDAIRQRAPSTNSPAWRDFRPEMARKIVLKRICKRLPTERVVDLEDMDDRMGREIEGVATNIETLAIASSDEQPINTVDMSADDTKHDKDGVVVEGVASESDGKTSDASLFPEGG